MQPHRGRTRCAVRYASAAEISDVLTCTVPPLRVESSLLKNPIPNCYSSK
jgi:hypothetical protein